MWKQEFFFVNLSKLLPVPQDDEPAWFEVVVDILKTVDTVVAAVEGQYPFQGFMKFQIKTFSSDGPVY